MPYEIEVERGEKTGKLSYTNGGFRITATCWWDPHKKIPDGTYSRCSATHMATKGREGIFIPNVRGYRGIFIHKGTSAAWSDGCIVINEADLLRIWNDINPKNGQNVTVRVRG